MLSSTKGKRAKSPHPLKDFQLCKPQDFTTDKNIKFMFKKISASYIYTIRFKSFQNILLVPFLLRNH